MTMILEPARETPVIHETGVLVIGSGPGGLAAALAAARAGAEVTLLDRFGLLWRQYHRGRGRRLCLVPP